MNSDVVEEGYPFNCLDSPNEEVASEARAVIKESLVMEKNKSFVKNLLEFYLMKQSKRMLSILIEIPDCQFINLLDKLSAGLRSKERFQYCSFLLCSVMQKPQPRWIQKIPCHSVLKDLLELAHSKDTEITLLVCVVLVLVKLLPNSPHDFGKEVAKFMKAFEYLIRWVPSSKDDVLLKPYLQVAVTAYFHVLYALFPCSFVECMRKILVNKENDEWYCNTLKPMLETVRFNPLLLCKTTISEKLHWKAFEPHDLHYECAKLYLDAPQEPFEAQSWTSILNLDQNSADLIFEVQGYSQSGLETSFWSPSIALSGIACKSVPNTPVYPVQGVGRKNSTVAESPPEAAIEATPETTPFTSPMKLDSSWCNKPTLGRSALSHQASQSPFPLSNSKCNSIEVSSSNTPLSPSKRTPNPFHFPLNSTQDVVSGMRLRSKLQQVIQEQNQTQVKPAEPQDESLLKVMPSDEELKSEAADESSQQMEKIRKSKTPMFDVKEKEIPKRDLDLSFSTEEETSIFRKVSDETDTGSEINKELCNQDLNEEIEEGLGFPEIGFQKDVRINRLRFLSQCGPPPNLALIKAADSSNAISPVGSESPVLPLKTKSRSCPDLKQFTRDFVYAKGGALTSIALSPKPQVKMCDAQTQIEETETVYDQLLGALNHPIPEEKKVDVGECSYNSYKLLEQYLKCKKVCDYTNLSEHHWSENERQQIRAMYMVLLYERNRKEIHEEINRRLFGKITRLSNMEKKEIEFNKQITILKKEIKDLKTVVSECNAKIHNQEERLQGMISTAELNSYKEQEKLQKILCAKLSALTKENQDLCDKLESSLKESEENKRLIREQKYLAEQNIFLAKQVENLQTQLLCVRELQQQVHDMSYSYSCSYDTSRIHENAVLELQKLQRQVDCDRSAYESWQIERQQLQQMLHSKDSQMQLQRHEMHVKLQQSNDRCAALQKRMDTIIAANLCLERKLLPLNSKLVDSAAIRGTRVPGANDCDQRGQPTTCNSNKQNSDQINSL